MKPVAFILEASSLSGGVKVIFEYAARLKKRGYSVHIWSLGKLPPWFDLGEVHWMQFQSYEQMLNFMKSDGRNFNKVATWWRTASVLNQDTGSKERGESFYLCQDLEMSYYVRPFEKQQVAETYQMGLRMFTCNEWVTYLIPMPCVGQAIDTNVFKPMRYAYPSDAVIFAFMRRQGLKGFSSLGELSRRLKVADSKIELHTAGVDAGGQLVGAHSRHFSGLDDEGIRQRYCSSTVFVSCSWHEGFSLPLIEAMACGCPTACFDAEGNMVFCKDGENTLVSPKGDVKHLTENVVRLIKDKPLRKKIVDNGFQTAKKYSDWDTVIDKVEEVLLQ